MPHKTHACNPAQKLPSAEAQSQMLASSQRFVLQHSKDVIFPIPPHLVWTVHDSAALTSGGENGHLQHTGRVLRCCRTGQKCGRGAGVPHGGRGAGLPVGHPSGNLLGIVSTRAHDARLQPLHIRLDALHCQHWWPLRKPSSLQPGPNTKSPVGARLDFGLPP